MLYLPFNAGSTRYVLPAKEIVTVIPVVMLRSVPQSPDYLIGLLNYQGVSIPIVDATRLLDGHKSDIRLSTRIILVTLPAEDNQQHTLGLLAEKVTEVMQLQDKDFVNAGLHQEAYGYLGEVVASDTGVVRRIILSDLIPHDMQKTIFQSFTAESDQSISNVTH